MNIANILTVSRLFLIPLILICLSQNTSTSILIGLIMIIAASITDYLDGKLARMLSIETSFGKFLDPLVDKFLVISIFIVLLSLEPDVIQFWMIIIIISREFLITMLRYYAISQEQEVETRYFGKLKTSVQLFTIAFIIVFLYLKALYIENDLIHPTMKENMTLFLYIESYFTNVGYFLKYSPYVLMLVTTIITFLSGVSYVWSNWDIITARGK